MRAKHILMKLLKEKVGGCKACRLSEARTNVVFGEGSPDARLMIVGEAPGADEDASGKPFVGKAGQKLDQILKYYKMSREDVFLTNSVLCCPPEGRQPLYEEEVLPCSHRLACQIAIIRPELILGLGSISAIALLGNDLCKKAGSFGALLDMMHIVDVDENEYPVIFTYHPAYLLEKSDDSSVKARAKAHWDRAMNFLDRNNG